MKHTEYKEDALLASFNEAIFVSYIFIFAQSVLQPGYTTENNHNKGYLVKELFLLITYRLDFNLKITKVLTNIISPMLIKTTHEIRLE